MTQGTTAGSQSRLDDGQPERDGSRPQQPDEATRARSLRPLLALRPYLLRYKGMIAAAALALVLSAMAMLAVPVAVRGMLDQGFSSLDRASIDRAFLMLIAIGAVLAAASSARFYCVNWLGERVVADIRGAVFQHLATLGPAFFER
ncbi:MAG TPA: ABC transporter transmembrane domain-containing protein, partial [Hyphomicrobiaceae bacterium]|nr:ABC transporter transmembrane domain-containing protein [Hyphomicrobiaceae bacterium]